MRIIVVDDKWLALWRLKRSIRKSAPLDAEVKSFHDTSEALKYASEQTVDTAFLDMEIPRMEGLLLAMRLKKLNPRINLIFVSDTDTYASDAWKLRASGYIRKPVKQERIVREFENLRYPAENQYIHV